MESNKINKNTFFVVPGEGLEPPPQKRHDPKSCASTNSASRANILTKITIKKAAIN